VIISHLIGGLGNQMFQYAHGRAVSLAHDVPLRSDTRGFASYTVHNGYELERVFSVGSRQADDEDFKRVLGWRAPDLARRLLLRRNLAGFRGKNFIVEPQVSYWPRIVAVPDNCYFVGYWQTERYFTHVGASIRADFSFRQPLSGHNSEVAAKIDAVTSVSLHVRRGDMARNAAALAIHGLCSLDYYSRAVEHVAARVVRPHFFIFSDDSLWVRQNLRIEHACHFVDHNSGLESYNDMHLMSLCRHHIIANSSFSWWGAWLDPRDDKIVVAPSRWFAAELDSSDIVPPTWVRI